MKIAFIRMRYVPYGGAENYLTIVGNELVKKGHEVHIFSNRWKGSSPETGSGSFIFHKVPVIKVTSFLKVLSFAICSYILIKKDKFDIILSFDRVLYQDIYRAGDGCHREWLEKRKVKESPLKTFLTMINPFHRTILYLERRIYQRNGCRRIIANSFKGRDDIVRYYKTPDEKIIVIYNGVDLNRFRPSNRDIYREEVRRNCRIGENDIVILFVGSGFERKGLAFLFNGVKLIKSRPQTPDTPASLRSTGSYGEAGRAGLKILVVGKGDYNYYKKMCRDIGIGEDVIFAGTTDMIEKFYAASDIFVLPTIYDPFSNACLEAMASGLPVVTTRNNGVSEIIKDSENGFVLDDPADMDALSHSIKLLMDEGLRKAMGKKAREKAEEFSIEDTVSKMVGICGEA
ncbi:MAG: glycosyltransferase family 4 protein [Nitrospirota bacterium]